jgi:hypothetical protein
VLLVAFASAQNIEIPDQVRQTFISAFWNELQSFAGYINWHFMLVFMIAAWLMNDMAEAENVPVLGWWSRIGKYWRTLYIGILLIPLFYWGFRYHDRMDIMKMLFAILMGLAAYRFGIGRIFRIISQYIFRMRFESK